MDCNHEYKADFSVVIVTYNHQAFIVEAIESVLMQQFTRELEIIIAIDKSSDETATIVKVWQQKFPHQIKVLEHTDRVGMYNNFKSAFAACTGKYIAILEGDDYWTDKRKLQLQYDFFEENENCVLTSGLCGTIQDGIKSVKAPLIQPLFKGKVFRKDDIIYVNRLVTLTVAFRAAAFNWKEFEKLKHAPHLDWGIYLSLNYQENSFIYRFNRRFGDYRKHAGGIYSLVGDEKRNINLLKTIYALYSLDLAPVHKEYMRYLFVNYSNTHRVSNFLELEPYKAFYNREMVIYDEKNHLRSAYIRKIFQTLYKDMPTGLSRSRLIRLHFELIRQTKFSRFDYLNFRILPFLLIAGIIKLKVNLLDNLFFSRGKTVSK